MLFGTGGGKLCLNVRRHSFDPRHDHGAIIAAIASIRVVHVAADQAGIKSECRLIHCDTALPPTCSKRRPMSV